MWLIAVQTSKKLFDHNAYAYHNHGTAITTASKKTMRLATAGGISCTSTISANDTLILTPKGGRVQRVSYRHARMVATMQSGNLAFLA